MCVALLGLTALSASAHAEQCDGFWLSESSGSYSSGNTDANIECARQVLSQMGVNGPSPTDPTRERLYTKESDTFYDITNTVTVSTSDIDICDTPEFTCSLNSAAPKAQYRCNGNNMNGGWIAEYSELSACWEELEICNWSPPSTEPPTEACVKIRPTETRLINFPESYLFTESAESYIAHRAQVAFAPYEHSSTYDGKYSKCGFKSNMGTHRSNIHKEYCLWQGSDYAYTSGNYTQYTPTEGRFDNDDADDFSAMDKGTGFTGQTGDDMFAIDRNSEGFLEYIDFGDDISNTYRLKHIARSGGGEEMDLMIPAGPRHTMKDYKDFVRNPPPSITVSDACYPAQMELLCKKSGTYTYEEPTGCGEAPAAGTCTDGKAHSVRLRMNNQSAVYGDLYKSTVFEFNQNQSLQGLNVNGEVAIGSGQEHTLGGCTLQGGCCSDTISFNYDGYTYTADMYAVVNADNDVEATISMSCSSQNTVIANNDIYEVEDEDDEILTVLTNDSSSDGSALILDSFTVTKSGSCDFSRSSVNTNAIYVETDSSWSGGDECRLTYTATSENGGSDTANICVHGPGHESDCGVTPTQEGEWVQTGFYSEDGGTCADDIHDTCPNDLSQPCTVGSYCEKKASCTSVENGQDLTRYHTYECQASSSSGGGGDDDEGGFDHQLEEK